ncbi:type II secretion system protein [Solidesulfovibrio sp. C21]|uniref:type II secretion system protein n=1 Tax=Solidesulfovibrio sp. C21 TaxID=3398613 RepID=UPI0039FB8F4D
MRPLRHIGRAGRGRSRHPYSGNGRSAGVRHACPPQSPPATSNAGFTLIEIVCVLVVVGILAVAAVSHYDSLLDESKRRGAQNLVAAAQTQLSLEFARRAVAGLALDADAQNICGWVIIDSPDVAASIHCTGNIGGDVSITANIEAQNVTGNWNSPLAGGT